MCALRLATAAFVAVVCATSVADAPVLDFPARFANHERLVAVGVLTGHGESRHNVQRLSNDDELVLDDATNLRFVDPDSSEPDVTATWRWSSHRVLTFRMTPETVARLKDELNATVPFRVHVGVGTGRLQFSRDHQSYTGSQVVRCAGDYRGYHISVVETMHYSGSRTTKAAPVAAAGTLSSTLGDSLRAVVAELRPGLLR
jgi:hypothetical protein